MTYFDFVSYKRSFHARDIQRARAARLAGNREAAAWYLNLAAAVRRSIEES